MAEGYDPGEAIVFDFLVSGWSVANQAWEVVDCDVGYPIVTITDSDGAVRAMFVAQSAGVTGRYLLNYPIPDYASSGHWNVDVLVTRTVGGAALPNKQEFWFKVK